MRVVSLASGSKGNAYLVEHCVEALLIDCGVCYKKLKGVEFSAQFLLLLLALVGRCRPRPRPVEPHYRRKPYGAVFPWYGLCIRRLCQRKE